MICYKKGKHALANGLKVTPNRQPLTALDFLPFNILRMPIYWKEQTKCSDLQNMLN